MKTLLYYTFLLIIFYGVFGCTNNSDCKQDIAPCVDWPGKVLNLPLSSEFLLYGKDSVKYNYSESPYKILVFIGASECIGCKLNILNWKKFIHEVDSITLNKAHFIFVLEPIYPREVYTILKSHQFSIPVYIDTSKQFRLINQINDEASYVFLLDHNNQVLYTGDPLSNKEIRESYLRLIQFQ